MRICTSYLFAGGWSGLDSRTYSHPLSDSGFWGALFSDKTLVASEALFVDGKKSESTGDSDLLIFEIQGLWKARWGRK